jgi:S1-C subfamily serine protease
MTNSFGHLLVLLVCLAASSSLDAAETRYAARFSDGSRMEGNSLVNWHNNNAQPQLEGRSLLDPNNPFRWLRDRTLSPGPEPTAYVEFVTGDSLPGNVVGYAAAGAEFDPLPGHFVVEPLVTLRPQHETPRSTIRVIAKHIRRIVWQRSERARYQPNTLLMRDGRTLTYRAIRFDDGSVSVLTSEGNKRISFHDLAEAHLPAADFWQRYLEELAVLSPQGTTRLYQLETTEGLIVTGAFNRMAIYTHGSPQDPKTWYHGLQPAWSLDVLWIPNEKVWLRRSFAPHEVPLSRIPPTDVKQQATLGKVGQPWHRDRNLADEPLRSGGREWGFGIGSATTTDLTFDLPPGAKSLRGSVGLDRLAGKGGCAKGEISAGTKQMQKLWTSPILQGSDQTHDFGPLTLPAPKEPQKIVLHADAVIQGRPAGADPLEVRDFVDWLDPLVEFDPAVWHPAIRQKVADTIPAWSQWQVNLASGDPNKPAKIEPFNVGEFNPGPGNFRTGVVLEQPLVLSRKLSPSSQDQWLVMHVTRARNEGNEPRLEVRIGGELVGEFKVPAKAPVNAPREVRPLVVPLLGYPNREIEVQLTLFPEPGSNPIDWQSLRTAEQLPTLYRIFEEESRFVSAAGATSLASGEGQYGMKSLQIKGGTAARIAFDPPLRIREKPQWGDFRQLRFVVQKKGKGHVLIELEGRDQARPRILRFGASQNKSLDHVAAHDQPLPDQWLPFSRDLYADFGSFDIEAMTLRVPDGEFALWDHIYLANDASDFPPDQLAHLPSPELVQRKVDPTVAEELFKHAKQFVALIDFGEGRIGNGVVSNGNGELLTAGHLVLAPNREVKITLPDGKEVKGKTRGVCRDFDLGMVKIEPEASYPAISINHWAEPPTQSFYAAVVHRQGAAASGGEGHIVDLRRVFKGTTWTTLQVPQGLCGGALVNKDKQLIGILTRYSPFGGAEFANTFKLNEIDARLRNGEVWGRWRDGAGPQFGFTAEPQPEGAKVTAVEAGGPAAQAGVQIADLVVKIDGKPTHGLDDVYAAFAERDPGHEATLELLRGGQPVTVKLKLLPRMP